MGNIRLMTFAAALLTGGLGYLLLSAGISDAADDNLFAINFDISNIPVWWIVILAVLVILSVMCLSLWYHKEKE